MRLEIISRIGRILLVIFILSSCNSEPSNLSDYDRYITNPQNGYLKERNAGPFIFTLQYLPPKYLALKEVNVNHSSFDSIYQFYTQSLNFQFTISPNPDKATGDVTRSSIHSIEQYDQRLRTLNFQMKDYWTLTSSAGTLYPILTQLEQTGGLTDYRRIQLAFVSPDSTTTLSKPWTLTFNDEIWGTGVNRWRWK